MGKIRPEQLGWGLTADLAINASGSYFVFDSNTGNIYLDFTNQDANTFSIQKNSSSLFFIDSEGNAGFNGEGTVTFGTGKNVIVSGSLTFASGSTLVGIDISGSSITALTASHLEEKSVSYYTPIETPLFISGGFFRSSSGDWFVS